MRLTKERNAELAAKGDQALSLEELDADVARKLALYAALEFQVRSLTFLTQIVLSLFSIPSP